MISIGDYVRHQTTGQSGQVVAYGHQIKDGIYLPTLTVRLTRGKRVSESNFIEDVSSIWVLAEESGIPEISLDRAATGAIA
jgi:hypothetical protein